MAAISGKVARLRYTSATATSSTNNAATLSTDGVTLSINSTALRLWNKNNSTALVIYAGSTAVPVADYDVQWPVGKAVFTAARSTSVTYTIDVETYTAAYLAGGRNWGVNVAVDSNDVTTFSTSTADTQWRSKQAGLSGATVTIQRLVQASDTGPIAFDRINAEQNLIAELILNGTSGARYLAYANVTGDDVQSDIEGLAEEGIDLEVDEAVYFSTG